MLSGESELDILRADPEYYLEAATYFEKAAVCNQDYDFPSVSGKNQVRLSEEKREMFSKKGKLLLLKVEGIEMERNFTYLCGREGRM